MILRDSRIFPRKKLSWIWKNGIQFYFVLVKNQQTAIFVLQIGFWLGLRGKNLYLLVVLVSGRANEKNHLRWIAINMKRACWVPNKIKYHSKNEKKNLKWNPSSNKKHVITTVVDWLCRLDFFALSHVATAKIEMKNFISKPIAARQQRKEEKK